MPPKTPLVDSNARINPQDLGVGTQGFARLDGREANDFLKSDQRFEEAADVSFANYDALYVVTSVVDKQALPDKIVKYVPSDVQSTLKHMVDKANEPFEPLIHVWWRYSSNEGFGTQAFNLDVAINPDNVASMFSTEYYLIRDGRDNSGRLTSENTKMDVVSGRTFLDLFETAAHVLREEGVFNQKELTEVLERKLENIQEEPNSLFPFRFDTAINMKDFRALADKLSSSDKYPQGYITKLLKYMEQWDAAQKIAVQALMDNEATPIRGLLPAAMPESVTSRLEDIQSQKAGAVNDLAIASSKVGPSSVYEAIAEEENLPDPVKGIVTMLNTKAEGPNDEPFKSGFRTTKSLRGEILVHGRLTDETMQSVRALSSIVGVDQFDFSNLKPEESKVLQQQLNEWMQVTAPDKRIHIKAFDSLLSTQQGSERLDKIHNVAKYLRDIAKLLSKE